MRPSDKDTKMAEIVDSGWQPACIRLSNKYLIENTSQTNNSMYFNSAPLTHNIQPEHSDLITAS